MTECSTIAFFNQERLPLDKVAISVCDRSYFFGDAVYEVLRVYNGQPFLLEEHMARLGRSLNGIDIVGMSDLRDDILANIAINRVKEGMIYVQVSRGEAPRNHSFFGLDLKPNVLIYAKHFVEHPSYQEATTGITAITHE